MGKGSEQTSHQKDTPMTNKYMKQCSVWLITEEMQNQTHNELHV